MWKQFICLAFVVQCAVCIKISEITTPIIRSSISPVWDDITQSLYFVSLDTTGQQSSIFRYSYCDDVFYSAYVEGVNSLAFILPVEAKWEGCEDRFLVGAGSQVLTIQWNGKSTRATVIDKLTTLDKNIPNSRTSIARTSPNGRFFGGTYSQQLLCKAPSTLSFYRYNLSGKLERIFGHLKSTSGIAFDKKACKIYHLDTCQLCITVSDWNPTTGKIANRRVAFDFQQYNATVPLNFPLGLEIDTNGLLYTVQPQAVWVIDPMESCLVKIIKFPSPVLNGLAFGGPERNILYVVAAPNFENPFTLEVISEKTNTTTSLYMVTGLIAAGAPSTRVDAKECC